MKKKHQILIAEPSEIVTNGIKNSLTTSNINAVITTCYTLSETLMLPEHKSFDLIIVNPVILNNNYNKFFEKFQKTSILGIITSYYEREICKRFEDCIFLNDKTEILINIIKKNLITQEENRVVENTPLLTGREKDVLKLLVLGGSNKEIAQKLHISIHTVITHRKNISAKLKIKSTAAMAIYAVANNIIDIDNSLSLIK